MAATPSRSRCLTSAHRKTLRRNSVASSEIPQIFLVACRWNLKFSSVSGLPSFQSAKGCKPLRPSLRLASAVRRAMILARGVCRATRVFRDCFGRSNQRAGEQAVASFLLAGESKNHVSRGIRFAAIHGLLRIEGEGPGLCILDRGLGDKCPAHRLIERGVE